MIKRIFGCIPFASIIVANALYGVFAYWVYQAMQEVPNDRTMPVLFGGVVGCAIMLNIGLFALFVRDLLWEFEDELVVGKRLARVVWWRLRRSSILRYSICFGVCPLVVIVIVCAFIEK